LAADAAFSVGDYFYNNKSYDSALVAYTRFVERFPDNARAEEAQQLIHELGQVEAYKAYESAMEFFDAKNWKIAIEELTKVMEKFPETDVVYGCKANIASAHAQLGERQRALQMFDEIIEHWKDIEAARPAVFFAELHKRWIEAGR
jgi:outer membrane protein assembly factor BamD (BamD/ComL family)